MSMVFDFYILENIYSESLTQQTLFNIDRITSNTVFRSRGDSVRIYVQNIYIYIYTYIYIYVFIYIGY